MFVTLTLALLPSTDLDDSLGLPRQPPSRPPPSPALSRLHLRAWLRHGDAALERLEKTDADPLLARHNQLSQFNVLSQIENLKTYPVVRERVQAGRLRLHGWWFEIKNADVYAYESSLDRFVLIDRTYADRLLKRLD